MDKKKTHYLVHGLFWKKQMHNIDYLEAKKDNLCCINKTFEDADLKKARLEAFAYFQSLIDVLYEALGLQYTDDEQAQIDLQVFFHAGCSNAITRIGRLTFDDNLLNEIGVYRVKNGKKKLIRGIGYQPDDEPKPTIETPSFSSKN
jgi:hypothetical protein